MTGLSLWLLKRINPEAIYYDEARGFVIRAIDKASARKLAGRHHGDEGASFWTNPAKASCEPLLQHGPEEMILCDFLNG